MKKQKKAAPQPSPATGVSLLENLRAEIAEGVELLKPHYPEAGEAELQDQAQGMLGKRYATGRWPTADELAAKAAAERAAADKPAPMGTKI